MLDFLCAKFNCKMQKDTCRSRIYRSQHQRTGNWLDNKCAYDCKDCTQIEEILMDQDIAKPNVPETRKCYTCGKVKDLRNDFRVNKKNPKRRVKTCKACEVDPPSTKVAEKSAKPIVPDYLFITIDFTDHRELLTWIEKKAVQEFRTTELQILSMIDGEYQDEKE